MLSCLWWKKRKTKGTPLRGLFKARRSCKRFEFCLVGILKKKEKRARLSEKFGLLVRGPLYSSPPRREFFFFCSRWSKIQISPPPGKISYVWCQKNRKRWASKAQPRGTQDAGKKMKSAQEYRRYSNSVGHPKRVVRAAGGPTTLEARRGLDVFLSLSHIFLFL